jgi:hypothetical protein
MSILRLIYGEQVFHIVGQKNLCSLIFMEHAQTIIFNYVSEKKIIEKDANEGLCSRKLG